MSPFEIGMLICFGVSWPISIFSVWKTKRTEGKSLVFAAIVFIGYVSGILHKLFFYYDYVIYLYGLNLLFVSIDLGLTVYYRSQQKCLPEKFEDTRHQR
jgi:hypothetical protein